jgi:hypothetical protein
MLFWQIASRGSYPQVWLIAQTGHFTVRPFKTIPEGSVHVQDSPAGPRP